MSSDPLLFSSPPEKPEESWESQKQVKKKKARRETWARVRISEQKLRNRRPGFQTDCESCFRWISALTRACVSVRSEGTRCNISVLWVWPSSVTCWSSVHLINFNILSQTLTSSRQTCSSMLNLVFSDDQHAPDVHVNKVFFPFFERFRLIYNSLVNLMRADFVSFFFFFWKKKISGKIKCPHCLLCPRVVLVTGFLELWG